MVVTKFKNQFLYYSDIDNEQISRLCDWSQFIPQRCG